MHNENSYVVVFDVLTKAASQNPEFLKNAEEQLHSWETVPGFYSILLSVYSDYSIDPSVRCLAVLYFKNGVDRYWRKTAPNAISEEEKKALRLKMLSCVGEPINQLALQLAVLMAKIARYDFPNDWPELIPTLLETLKKEDPYQQRSFLILHHVIKSLASKRLTGGRREFQELAKSMLSFILQMWATHTELFLQQAALNQENSLLSLEKSLLSLKLLRKLVVHGCKQPHLVPEAVAFLKLVFERIKPFLECSQHFINHPQIRDVTNKYCILLMKVIHDILEVHPFSFGEFIKPSLECAVSLCFTPLGEGLLFERFVVQCFNLIKAILLCAEYRPAKIPDDIALIDEVRNAVLDTQDPLTLEAHQIKMEFFTPNVLKEIFRQLLSHYFLLTKEDLNTWETDPEQFLSDENGDDWKYSLRPSAECLFLTLFHEFGTTYGPLLLDMIKNIQNVSDHDDLQIILQKDAVYNAIGLAAFELYDELDFDTWLTQWLVHEVKRKGPINRIIRRRVIWLIGQWFGIKLAPQLRPLVYQLIVSLLDEQEDLVVKYAAAGALKNAVNAFEFNRDEFAPYLESTVHTMYLLLKEVSECDTKMAVLHILSLVIERVKGLIKPYSHILVRYLPLLWQSSAEHAMLRCAILSTLVHLVQGFGNTSESLHSFLLPVIAYSTDINEPQHVYLLEEGLDLWLAVVMNAINPSEKLLNLAVNIIPVLENGTETMQTYLDLVDSYLLLFKEAFLEKVGKDLAQHIYDLLPDLGSLGLTVTTRFIEGVFIACPKGSTQTFQLLLPQLFKIVIDNEEVPTIIGKCLSIFGHIILCQQDIFINLLMIQTPEGQSVDKSFARYMDVWLEKMPLVTKLKRRKLLGLALACLLTSNSSVIHQQFCGILLAIVEVLNDLIKTDDLTGNLDSLVITDWFAETGDDLEETENAKRKKKMQSEDIIHTVPLKEYVSSQLTRLREMVGETTFEDLMSSVDCETMQQLKSHLT